MSINEREKADILNNKRVLSELLNESGIYSWSITFPSGEFYQDPEKEKMLGYSSKLRNFSEYADCIHPDDLGDNISRMFSYLEGAAEKFECVYRIRNSFGDYIWFKDEGKKITGSSSSEQKVIGISTNINHLVDIETKLSFTLECGNSSVFMLKTDRMELDFTSGLTWNYFPNWESKFNFPSEYDNFIKLVHKSDMKTAESYFTGFFNGMSDNGTAEFRVENKSGIYEWVRFHGRVITKTNINKPETIIFSCSEINSFKEKELEWYERMEKIKVISDNIYDGIFVFEEKKVFYASPSFYRMLCISEDEIMLLNRDDVFSFIYKDDRERVLREIYNSIDEKEKNVVQKHRIKNKNEGIKWIENNISFLYDKNGTYKSAVVICRDITARVVEEMANKELADRLLCMINNINAAIIFENGERTILNANRMFCQMFGINCSPEELKGKNCAELGLNMLHIVPDILEFVNRINSIIEGKTKVSNEEIALSDGRVLERDYIPVCSCSEVIGNLWVYRDITESKKLTRSLISGRQKFNALMSALPDQMFILSKEGLIMDYIEAEESGDKGGVPYLNENIYDIFPKETAEIILSEIGQPYKNEINLFIEYPGNKKNKIFDCRIVKYIEGQFLAIIRDITEKRNAETELWKSEIKLKSFISSANAVFLMVDTEGKILFSEGKELQLLNASSEQLKGKNISELFRNFPEIMESFYMTFSGVETKKILLFNNYTFECTFSKVYGNNKDFLGVVCLMHDVTERIQLSSYARILTVAVSNANFAVLITDSLGVITYTNPFFLRYAGYKLSDIIGSHVRNFFAGKESEELFDEIKEKIIYGESCEGEFSLRKKGGELFSESFLMLPVRNGSNAITHVVVIKDNNKEILKRERELNNYKLRLEELVAERTKQYNIQNALLYTLLNTLPYPIFVKDADLNYTIVNNAFKKFFNVKDSDIIGKNGKEFLPEKMFIEVAQMDKELIKKPGSRIYESEIIKTDGVAVPILINKSSLFLSEKKPYGIVGIIIDITFQKELEQKKFEAYKKELELNEMKSHFITVVSHEIRTPLTALVAAADLLDMNILYWEPEKTKEHLAIIQSCVVSITSLLEEVVNFNKQSVGNISISLTAVDVSEQITKAVNQSRINLRPFQEIVCSNKLKETVYKLDAKIFQGIVLNLLGNALKFSPEKSKVFLGVRYIKSRQLLEVKVKDCGIGISESEVEKIYEPFFRAKNASAFGGSGLGLSIVKHSVEMLGGTITVKSKLNKGSVFTVLLKTNRK
jgi:PAS domain S-box-containing protein